MIYWRYWTLALLAIIAMSFIIFHVVLRQGGPDIRTAQGQVSGTTADLQRVDVFARILYEIEPEHLVELNNRYGSRLTELLIMPAIGNVLRRHLATVAFDEFLLTRSDIAGLITSEARSELAPRGILIEVVHVTHLNPDSRPPASPQTNDSQKLDPQAILDIKTHLAAIQALCERSTKKAEKP